MYEFGFGERVYLSPRQGQITEYGTDQNLTITYGVIHPPTGDLSTVKQEDIMKVPESLFGQVFLIILSDQVLFQLLLRVVKHERSRDSYIGDIEDIVATILEEDVPALKQFDLEGFAFHRITEFLVAWVDPVDLDPEYLTQNGFESEVAYYAARS